MKLPSFLQWLPRIIKSLFNKHHHQWDFYYVPEEQEQCFNAICLKCHKIIRGVKPNAQYWKCNLSVEEIKAYRELIFSHPHNLKV